MARESENQPDENNLASTTKPISVSKSNKAGNTSPSSNGTSQDTSNPLSLQHENGDRRSVRKKFKSRSKSLDNKNELAHQRKSREDQSKVKKMNSKQQIVKVIKTKTKLTSRPKKKTVTLMSPNQGRNSKEVVITKRPQASWSSDSSDDHVTDDDSLDGNNMAAHHSFIHRSDHSYEERDDLLFDTDEERGAENMENSDEDTEDASETDMATLEEELTEMKEKMYLEKVKELRQQLDSLKQGTHPEYLEKLKIIERQREDWIDLAEAYKEYELMEVEREYKKEKEQAITEFETKKVDLKESLISELIEKKKNIENEKITMELTGDVMEVKPVVTRKLRRRPNEPPPAPEKKRKTYSKLNLLLSDEHIMADLKRLNRLGKTHLLDLRTSSPAVKTAKGDSATDDLSVVYEARIEDGRLLYDKKWYQKGQSIYLEAKEGLKFTAQIHSIGTNELWVKKLSEGTRLKIYLTSLHKGKYVIRRRGNTSSVAVKE